MTAPELAVLLHLVDRAERGTLLAPEAVALRAGLRAWATELTQARRTVGGLQAEIRRLRGQVGAVSAGDSRSDPRKAEAGPDGTSRGLAASARPSPATSP